MTTTNVSQATRVASMGKVCREEEPFLGKADEWRHSHQSCCHGTGWLYALPDSVRVSLAPSKGGVVWSHVDCPKLGHCDIAETMPAFPDCHGLGWTGSTDPDVWLNAVWKKWPNAEVMERLGETFLWTGRHPAFTLIRGDTLLDCIEQALTDEGYSVSPMVKKDRMCECWYVFDRNEGRSGTIRWCPKDDCAICGGTGFLRPSEETP